MATLDAVIEIGSTGIRLTVAEISAEDKWSIVDHSELPLAFGSDVFNTGYISVESLKQCLRVLFRMKEQLAAWAIENEHVSVIATSALREAKNRDLILDRILIKTGFKVRVIDGIEENRLMYAAVMEALGEHFTGLKKQNSVIIEVGGGSTEILLLDHGKVAAAHSLRLGTVIVEQHIKTIMGTQKDALRFLEDYIKNAGGALSAELDLGKVKHFIAIGAESLLAAQTAGKKLSETLWLITRKAFEELVDEIQKYTPEECVARFKIPYADARNLNIHLLTLKLFLALTKAKEIYVPATSLREGYVISKISKPNVKLQQDLLQQITASAYTLARKYHIDETHAEHVTQIALKLFDSLRSELGLNDHARVLLEVSAILHDIGMFINGSDHHLHSQYIIAHSEIFGLIRDDIQIVSNVARYHRGALPRNTDGAFGTLPRTDRTTVAKLASLLRIADSLDRGHAQRINTFTIALTEENLVITIKGTHDITLEKTALAEKSDLFEAVFGYKILLL